MITLRNIEYADIPLVQKYASEPSIGQMSYVPSPYPQDGAIEWFKHNEELIKKDRTKILVIQRSSEFAGIVALNEICYNKYKTNIDYWVRADLQGKGIGSLAVKAAINLANGMGIVNFYSNCLAINIASRKVLENNGFCINKKTLLAEGKFAGKDLLLMSKVSTHFK